nr:TetR/AcrR family transcriptional regulator C-terminal domain-containing protein [Rhizobium ruizarguesonis]
MTGFPGPRWMMRLASRSNWTAFNHHPALEQDDLGRVGLKSESCSKLNSWSMMSSENRSHFSANVLYARGPARALKVVGSAFEQFAGKKLLQLSDSTVAASQFNWLVMADPVNRVMMLGDATIPTKQEIHRHAEAAVATFLAAFLHPDQR